MNRAIAIIFAASLVMALAGHDDYEEAERAADAYCERVEAGVHTDYEELCQ